MKRVLVTLTLLVFATEALAQVRVPSVDTQVINVVNSGRALNSVSWDQNTVTTWSPSIVDLPDSTATQRVAAKHIELRLSPGATVTAAKSGLEVHVESVPGTTANYTGTVRGLHTGVDNYGNGTIAELTGNYALTGSNLGTVTLMQGGQNYVFLYGTGTATTMNGTYSFVQTSSTGAITRMRASRNQVSHAADSQVTDMYGSTGDIQLSGGDSGGPASGCTNCYGFWSNIQVFSANASRTATTAYNYFAQMQSLGSGTANAYGYYVSDLSSAEPPTARWSFWNNDAGAPSVNRARTTLAVMVSQVCAPQTITTAGAVTYTADNLSNCLILRDPNGAARSDTTPTAAQLVAAMPGAQANQSFEFVVRNTADAAETITILAGAGVTLSGTMTIAQNNSKRFLVVCPTVTGGAEACTLYSLGTSVH